MFVQGRRASHRQHITAAGLQELIVGGAVLASVGAAFAAGLKVR